MRTTLVLAMLSLLAGAALDSRKSFEYYRRAAELGIHVEQNLTAKEVGYSRKSMVFATRESLDDKENAELVAGLNQLLETLRFE